MLRRLNKLIMIGVLSATMLFSNTLVFAADEAASAETQASETQAPETDPSETQVTETQAPETQTSETKTPTPTPEAPNIMDGSDDARKAAESEGIKNSPYATNEELIAHQNIISVKPLTKDFRFTQVEADKVIVKAGSKVYEGKNENSRVVGKAKVRSLAYILADGDSEWIYIESGDCRGFVKSEDMITGNIAEFILSRDGALQDIYYTSLFFKAMAKHAYK